MCASEAARFIDYSKENATLGCWRFEMRWTSSMTAHFDRLRRANLSAMCASKAARFIGYFKKDWKMLVWELALRIDGHH